MHVTASRARQQGGRKAEWEHHSASDRQTSYQSPTFYTPSQKGSSENLMGFQPVSLGRTPKGYLENRVSGVHTVWNLFVCDEPLKGSSENLFRKVL